MSEENWYGELAGEDTDRAEALGKFENSEAFFEAHDKGVAALDADWRDAYADGDDKFKSTLDRFSTPADMGKTFREAQQTIRSGQQHSPPAENAEESDITAYRETQGLPAEAAGYLENLPDGLVLGEDDLPIAEVFMGALHKSYAPPRVAHALIEGYNEFAEKMQDEIAETDATQHTETEDTLRQSWGNDYRANINMIGAFLESNFGAEAKEQMMNGRFPDGRAFMNDPKVLEGIAAVQRKLDPMTRLIPPGGDPSLALNDEIAELEKFQKEHRTEYFKDEVKQARLRELYQIRIDHKAA